MIYLLIVVLVAVAWTIRSGPGRHERPQTYRRPRLHYGYEPRHQAARSRHQTTQTGPARKAVTA